MRTSGGLQHASALSKHRASGGRTLHPRRPWGLQPSTGLRVSRGLQGTGLGDPQGSPSLTVTTTPHSDRRLGSADLAGGLHGRQTATHGIPRFSPQWPRRAAPGSPSTSAGASAVPGSLGPPPRAAQDARARVSWGGTAALRRASRAALALHRRVCSRCAGTSRGSTLSSGPVRPGPRGP